MNFLEKIKLLRYHAFYKIIQRKYHGLAKFGEECSWAIQPSLDAKSRVLCAGAGHDISFELDLCRKFDCEVHLLDPSPTGLTTWEREKVYASDKIHYWPVALSTLDGKLFLGEPADLSEGSFRSKPTSLQDGIEVPARSISSIMQELQWDGIDLLKMDIEGGEFEVLESIHSKAIPVKQICVEFHHGSAFSTTAADSRSAILKMLKHNYRLVHHIHWDHTFIRKDYL